MTNPHHPFSLRKWKRVGQYKYVVESLTYEEPRPIYRGIKILSRFMLELRNAFQMLTDKVNKSGKGQLI